MIIRTLNHRERALRYFRAGCPDNEDQTEWAATLMFIKSHGISFDWILRGDVCPMICRLAALDADRQNLDEPTLAHLIDNLAVTKAAAEAACTKLSDTEEKYRDADGKLAKVATPNVCGGMTEAMTIIVDEKRTDHEPSKWLFRSGDEVKKEGTPEQLADWDRQAKAAARKFPKELRAAEREQLRAMSAWTAAERALVAYKPTSAAEAVELLTLAGKPQERGALYLDIDEGAYHRLVSNCSAALREALAH